MISEGKIYKMPEVTKILGMDRKTIYRLIKNGDLRAFRTSKGARSEYRIIGRNIINFVEGKDE